MNIQRFRSMIGLVCAVSIGLAACGTKADKDAATTAEIRIPPQVKVTTTVPRKRQPPVMVQ